MSMSDVYPRKMRTRPLHNPYSSHIDIYYHKDIYIYNYIYYIIYYILYIIYYILYSYSIHIIVLIHYHSA